MKNELPNRKNIRLKEYDYSSEGYYFITICTRNKHCIFGDVINEHVVLNEYGEIAENEIEEIATHYNNVEIVNYVVMPNHIHMVVVINPTERINPAERINPFPTNTNFKGVTYA